VVKVDRVEWVIIKDPQTQANALIAGDVDLIVEPPFTQYPSLRSSSDIQMFVANTVGYGFYLRFNHLQPPFDKPIARQAAMAAMNQSAFLRTQVGDAELYRTCFSVYHCKTRFAVPDGMDFIAKPDPERARRLLSESGYDGTRVVILQSTDMSTLARLPVVAAQLLERAGFKVTVEAMDSQTVQMRRAKSEGWNIFLYYGSLWSGATPISALSLSAAGEKAWFGWPSDVHLEQLRHAFAFATTDEERMALATQIQVRAMQVGTHVPLGEFTAMLAARKNVRGFVVAPVMALWNVEKDR
jgi:peptide/nickel transport system substrate-binding protein